MSFIFLKKFSEVTLISDYYFNHAFNSDRLNAEVLSLIIKAEVEVESWV